MKWIKEIFNHSNIHRRSFSLCVFAVAVVIVIKIVVDVAAVVI